MYRVFTSMPCQSYRRRLRRGCGGVYVYVPGYVGVTRYLVFPSMPCHSHRSRFRRGCTCGGIYVYLCTWLCRCLCTLYSTACHVTATVVDSGEGVPVVVFMCTVYSLACQIRPTVVDSGEGVPVVLFMYRVFTSIPNQSCRRRFRRRCTCGAVYVPCFH